MTRRKLLAIVAELYPELDRVRQVNKWLRFLLGFRQLRSSTPGNMPGGAMAVNQMICRRGNPALSRGNHKRQRVAKARTCPFFLVATSQATLKATP